MSERDVIQTLKWVDQMRGEAVTLERDPRDQHAMQIATGLRATIDQAQRLVHRLRSDLLEVQS